MNLVVTVNLPSPEIMAALISGVTRTMMGMTFDLVRDAPRELFRAAVLPIPGARPLSLVIASDRRSCQILGAAMFGCDSQAVDDSMMEDTLTELANITAGHLKRAMSLDQALGLPRILRGSQPAAQPFASQNALLRAGDVELHVRLDQHPTNGA